MKQTRINSVFFISDRESRLFNIRYKKNSDVDLILSYLQQKDENASELIRELLIAALGVEVFAKNPQVSQEQLELLAEQSIGLLTLYLEKIRFRFGLNSQKIIERSISKSEAKKSELERAQKSLLNEEALNRILPK